MFRAISILMAAGLFLAGCGAADRNKPQVTSVYVMKSERLLLLLNGNEVVRSYEMEMGFAPEGHKEFEGDGKTPEGVYYIDRRNPNSQFHLSLGISYPNRADYANATAQGRDPGGDIFIHGTPRDQLGRDDWTAGCIAVTNDEMEEIWALVSVGTPIFIMP